MKARCQFGMIVTRLKASLGFVWELAKAYSKQLVTERLGYSL